MTFEAQVFAELKKSAAGVPVSAQSLAQQLGCSEPELLCAAKSLESRRAGDDELVTVVTKRDSGDNHETAYVFWTPLPLTDEAGQ